MFGVYSVDYAIVVWISVGILPLQHVFNNDSHFTMVMTTKKSNIHLNSVETM